MNQRASDVRDAHAGPISDHCYEPLRLRSLRRVSDVAGRPHRNSLRPAKPEQWRCNALNEKSRAAARRLGFRFEGIWFSHMIVKGRNRDTAWVHPILDTEWPAIRSAIDIPRSSSPNTQAICIMAPERAGAIDRLLVGVKRHPGGIHFSRTVASQTAI